MKIFQLIQERYALIGISASNQLDHKHPFNSRIVFGILLFGYAIVLKLVYIDCEADGFMGYLISISSACTTAIVFVCFAAVVFRKATLFKSIDRIEELIDTSEPISILCLAEYFVQNSSLKPIHFRI